ncbi:hypothetical protein [uncultured Mediterranean phage]|nr:hypothetical protein [uncultured Mediterranean phage]
MKLEVITFAITGFLILNTYYDGKYTKILMLGRKYFKMIMYAFIGFSVYLFMKRNPDKSRGLVSHASTLIKYMPIDKKTGALLAPFLNGVPQAESPQIKRMLRSGGNGTKRSVSETKKKHVAASQNWRCAVCQAQLMASFEIDHKIALQDGGTNHVNNLEALCRNCHGEKTAKRNL